MLKKIILGLVFALVLSAGARAADDVFPSSYAHITNQVTSHDLLFTATSSPSNVNSGAGCATGCTWTVPATITTFPLAFGTSPGGAGGGGANATAAGGGGGGTGHQINNYLYPVAAGDVITITIPAAPAGGAVAGAGNTRVSTTVTGSSIGFFPTLLGGNPGQPGSGTTGGNSGAGTGGATAATAGAGGGAGCNIATTNSPLFCGGSAGGGGGSSGSAGGQGGAGTNASIPAGTAGVGGNASGGSGGSTLFGQGQVGTAAAASDCSSTPTWVGYGGGGCGGGETEKGGPGGPGMLIFRAVY